MAMLSICILTVVIRDTVKECGSGALMGFWVTSSENGLSTAGVCAVLDRSLDRLTGSAPALKAMVGASRDSGVRQDLNR